MAVVSWCVSEVRIRGRLWALTVLWSGKIFDELNCCELIMVLMPTASLI